MQLHSCDPGSYPKNGTYGPNIALKGPISPTCPMEKTAKTRGYNPKSTTRNPYAKTQHTQKALYNMVFGPKKYEKKTSA